MAFDPVTGIWAKRQAKKYTDAAIAAYEYGFNYKGTVPTEADLPMSGNQLGDVYNTADTGTEWVWTKEKISGTTFWLDLGVRTEDVPTAGSKKALSSGGAYTALLEKVNKTTTINGHTLNNDVVVTKDDIELGNVDNTSDLNKPISTATQTALDLKEDKLNKITSLEGDITDALYPSAKLVKDLLATKQEKLTAGEHIIISEDNVISSDLSDYTTHKELNTFTEKHVYETQDDTARNVWGGGWRLPTISELNELWALTWTFTEVHDGSGGRPGYETITANGNTIKLPTTSKRGGVDSDFINYPSSTLSTADNSRWFGKGAYAELWRGSKTAHNKYDANLRRILGFYIRPVLDKSAEANGHTAVDLGLSVLWADRNLGATSETDKGTMYAWGESTTKDTFTFENYKYAGTKENTFTKYVTLEQYGIIDNLTTLTVNKFIPKADIVDNLTSDDSTKVLSAKQGKLLSEGKQDTLTAGTAINITNNTVGLKYDDDTIKVDANGKVYANTVALRPMKSAWEGSNLTTAQAAEMILDDPETRVGEGYLGGVSWSDLSELGMMNAEVKAFVITGGIIQFEMTSADTEPFAWFFNSAGGVWRSYIPIENSLTSTSTTQALAANQGKVLSDSLTTHSSNTENPHSVTKALVELGNVDNTSDADKPISTAQQAALDLKQNATDDKLTTTDKTVTGAINELNTNKVNKDATATAGNIAKFDANGNLIDANAASDRLVVTSDSVVSNPALINADTLESHPASYFLAASDNSLSTTSKTVKGAINELQSSKLDKADSSLNTTKKTVVGAINEIKLDTDDEVSTRLKEVSKLDRRVVSLEGQLPASTTIEYPDQVYSKGDVPTKVCQYAALNKVKGNSILWSLLVLNGNFVDTEYWSTPFGSLTVNQNTGTFIANSKSKNAGIEQEVSLIKDHKYYVKYYFKPVTKSGITRCYWNNDFISDEMGTVVSTRSRYEFIFTANASITSIFRICINCNGPEYGETAEFDRVTITDLTNIYSQDNEPLTTTQVLIDYPALKNYCEYDTGSFKSTTVSGAWSKAVSGSNLDTITFPQVIEVKSANSAYDTYVPGTGKLTSIIGNVNLSTLTWVKKADSRFRANLADAKSSSSSIIIGNIVCNKYKTITASEAAYKTTIGIAINNTSTELLLYDSNYATVEELVESLSGTTLLYEKARSTTTTITTVDQYIEVVANGTVGLTHTEAPATESKFSVEYANLT